MQTSISQCLWGKAYAQNLLPDLDAQILNTGNVAQNALEEPWRTFKVFPNPSATRLQSSQCCPIVSAL